MFNKVSYQERLLFTKHLSIMLKSGITVSEGISSLAQETSSSSLRRVLSVILADIENGESLTYAMRKHSQVFDKFYVSLIEVGETSGTLDTNLEFLAHQLAKEYSLRKKIQGALLYPGIVLTAAIVMGGFIAFFILPQLTEFFTSFDIELPPATKFLIFISSIFKNYGIIILILTVTLAAFLRLIVKFPGPKNIWHSFKLRTPIFGNLILYGQLATFSRNLGTLLKSGVAIQGSLETTANTLTNVKLKNATLHINEELSRGANISSAAKDKFPPLVVKMIAVGEKTGKLDETLLYLGDFYEEEIDNISKNLSTVLEPIMLIGIGLIVGFVALAIISPIYELTGSIKK